MDESREQRLMDAIVQRADEHAALGALQNARGARTPALDDLDRRLARLRQMRAPLLVVSNGGAGALLRRLLNLPIRVFGYKQLRFNEELLDLLEATTTTLREQESEIAALRALLASRSDQTLP